MLVGLDPRILLDEPSLFRLIALGAGVRKANERRMEERRELAQMIRSEIVEAWNKGRS